MPRSRADLAQAPQPGGVGARGRSARCARCRPASRVARRARVRVQRLQRVDQHAGDVARVRSTRSESLVHVLQRVGVARRQPDCRRRAARRPTSRGRRRRSAPGACAACGSAPGAPPASRPRCRTCGTTPRPARRSRAAARTLSATAGMVGAEHRAERCDARAALGDAVLVEVVAEHVDAVRAGQVVEDVAVEVGDRDAAGRLHEARRPAGAGARSGCTGTARGSGR